MKGRVDDPDHMVDDAHIKLNDSLQKVGNLNADLEEVTTDTITKAKSFVRSWRKQLETPSKWKVA